MFLLALAAGMASAAEPAWTLDLGAPPWPFLSDAGVLLLATEGEVLGVDTADGTVRWRRPQPESVRGDLFQPVPFTDFVLLSTHAIGPDAYGLIDASTGRTVWAAPPGDAVLGVWAAPEGQGALVMSHRPEEPGFALSYVGLDPTAHVGWRVEDALRSQPVLGPTRSGRSAALTVRDAPLPVFDGDGVVTAWSPYDGFARHDGEGRVAWRLVVPGAERVLPRDGFADPVLLDGVLWAAVRVDKVVGLDVVTGQPRWRPRAGRVRGTVDHVAAFGDLVVAAGGPTVDALAARDGKRAWRQRLESPVRDLVVTGDGIAVVDALGVVRAWGVDGAPRFAVPVADDPGAVSLDTVGGLLVARSSRGVTALDATGGIAWRRQSEGALPESSWDRVGGADRSVELFREAPPADHPARTEHVWVVLDRVDGRSQAVLHRVDLLTGAEATVSLGTPSPRWLWDPHTGTAIVVGRGGHIEAFRPRPASP